jgi:hypothetical protein
MFSGTKNNWLVLVAIAALAAFVIACGTDETKLVSDNGNGGVGAQPTQNPDASQGDDDQLPVDPGYEVVDVLAPIESVDILVLESYPEQFVVEFVSGLPSGCATFSHTEMTQDGTDIHISVFNSVPSPEASAAISCIAIYGMHDGSIGLGSNFDRGTTFSVYVNDHPAVTFETGGQPIDGGGLPPAKEVPADHEVIQAPIEKLELIFAEDSRGSTSYIAHVVWGLTNGCVESYNQTVSRTDDSTFVVDALVTSPTGDVMCTDNYRQDSAEVVLGMLGDQFTPCAVYEVQAGKHSVSFQATASNLACEPAPPTATPTPPSSGGGIIADSHALELTLEAMGADVSYGGQSDVSKLFGLFPTEMKVNGQQVLVYGFAPGTSAEEASASVSTNGSEFKLEDGSIMSIGWIATPHFYLYGNAIILYVGDDVEMGELLGSLGDQFAGGDYGEVNIGDEGNGFATELATVENVQVQSTRSIPAQHNVSMTIALGGSCETSNSIDWSVEGREVHIEVLTQVPTALVPCTLAIIYEDQSVSIGSDFEAGVEYDIVVNGERQGSFLGG